MRLMAYTSEFTGDPNAINQVLAQIHRVSAKNNKASNITGQLIFHAGTFLQVVEGEKNQLEALMARLDTDPRHTKIRVFIDEEIDERTLHDWQMEGINLDDEQVIDRQSVEQFTQGYQAMFRLNAAEFLIHLRRVLGKKAA